MRQTLHIRMAINAGEHIAVDGMFQLPSIHKQARLLAVHFRRQGGVGVAGKAVFVLELMLGASRTGANQQRQGERLSEGSFYTGHAFEESLRRGNSQ
jgi:cbb3-type cytochrome oxidase cytochrome c subunit